MARGEEVKISHEKLLKIIDQALQGGWKALHLSGKGISDLPPEIGQLTNLTEINFSYNQVRELPPELGQLTKLTKLTLWNNQVRELPPEIGQLTKLTELHLSYNHLSELPPEIGQLTKLTKLTLEDNHLRELPPEIGRLTKLTEFHLWSNQLSELPPEIGQLTKLTKLTLEDNQLSELPPEIGQLTKLTKLTLEDNQLSELPPEIGRLTKLTEFHLSYNQLSELPPEIGRLTKLTGLTLNDNPLETPPMEIARRGIKAIARYFEQLEQEGVDYLYEAKLLIIGEGEAGKTSLARKVEAPSYQLQPDETSTAGIDIIQWHFRLPQEERDFQVNIWDFGGQEIYHATHQFFLTKRSLYALVVDNRKEHTNLYYWLNVVELLSDNSPLLIIQNEKEDRSVELNLRELRGQFTNLKEVLPTNLKTNRCLDDILSYLQHYLRNLPHVGDTIPKTWLKVRQTLETSEHNYISLADYLTICGDNGFEQHEDKLQLSSYLHDLGVCLHFQDDFLLKQTIIINPTWGTDAVYRVLDNEQVKKNLGRFSQDDLALIWVEDKYAAKQAELLQLMMKFKLCYPLPNQPGWYIAPHLLTKNQPEYTWDEANNLLLRYEYKFMPKGIITHFIVAMHRYIEQQALVWQSGVILTKDNTQAEVIEYYDRRELTIRVAGHSKRDFMIAITYELDKIHQSYRRLDYSKLVPCNCSNCKDNQKPYFYKFEDLRKRLDHRKYEIECYDSFEMVNVLGLIDDIGGQVTGTDHQQVKDLRKIILLKQQRLQKLKEQQALSGNSIDPKILLEIEDIQAEIERLQSELGR